MKKASKFFAPPVGMTLKAFAALLFAFFLFQACRHDAADAAAVEIPKSGWALTDRGNCGGGYCEFTIEATTDTVFLYFCGDIVPSSGSCNFGCNTLNNDQSYSALIPPKLAIDYLRCQRRFGVHPKHTHGTRECQSGGKV